jgi:quinol monooxygenase YgiN
VTFHFIVRFEPRPGKEAAFRDELRRVVESSRLEADCVSIEAFESLREPVTFAIHSEWVNEAAFDQHSELPHTVRFVHAAEELLTHSIRGLRGQRLAGGRGAYDEAAGR